MPQFTEEVSRQSNRLSAFRREVLGTTAIEYSLVAALIAIAIFTGLSQLGSSVLALFQQVHF